MTLQTKTKPAAGATPIHAVDRASFRKALARAADHAPLARRLRLRRRA
jgi:hypothetical protein